ncbi:hypothetical protein KI387_005588, partial [Taxus chinensis]
MYGQYPKLHVYAYGVLPCVDAVVADACSGFVTSIIYNDEFSSRLSVTSILRLRTAALAALAADSSTDSAMISKLTRRLLRANKYLQGTNNEEVSVQTSQSSGSMIRRDKNHKRRQRHIKYTIKGGESRDNASFEERTVLIQNSDAEKLGNDKEDARHKENNGNEFCAYSSESIITQTAMSGDAVSQPIDTNLELNAAEREPVEMYVPGLVIHIVPEAKQNTWPSWRNWKWCHGEDQSHRAILRHRESFKDVVVSPSMFLDHMPWRVHYAMQKVLETWNSRGYGNND